jgi:hypothetical protein
MPTTFSAATCITYNPGPVPTEGPFEIYLNNNYDVPPFIPYVTLFDVTGDECPYIIEVPTGTTVINFKDILTSYCISIPVQGNNICTNCDLGLSDYSATSIGNITAGYLTGSCNPSDYQIIWYGPNNPTLFSFSSGFGIFGVYGISASTVNHPLTGAQAIPREAGVYIPVITNVIANGIHYSITGDSSTIPADLNCLSSINVLPITCDTDTNPTTTYPLTEYKHYINLDVASTDLVDSQATFKITSNTKYLVWAFQGRAFADRITISFSGANYPDKIGLEDFVIGTCLDTQNPCQTNVSNRFAPNLFPKSARTESYFQKITTLTAFTINDYDEIIVDFKPSVPNTLWDFYMSCLDDWTCEDCITNPTQMKIIGSSVYRNTSGCNVTVGYTLDGCNVNYPNTSDYINYFSAYNNGTSFLSTFPISAVFQTPRFYAQNTTCIGDSSQCFLDSESTSYNKTFLPDGRGVFGFTGSSTFISTYYQSWVSKIPTCWSPPGPPPTDLGYYKSFVVKIPSQGSTVNCVGDTGVASSTRLLFHPTSIIETGTTGSQYYMTITANTITKQITYPSDPCGDPNNAIISLVNEINITSTSSSILWGTNRTFPSPGLYYKNPVSATYIGTGFTSSTTADTKTGLWRSTSGSFNTYPFSGTPSTLIPSLSGTVCNYDSYGQSTFNATAGQTTFFHYRHEYETRLLNSSNDFEIWATPIINGQLVPPKVLAYSNIGGVITTNPTYVI